MTRVSDHRWVSVLAAFLMALGMAVPSGMMAKEEQKPSEEPAAPKQPMDGPGLTEAQQRRYNAVGLALVKAINAGDTASYRALFTDEGWSSAIDWWRDMFARQTKLFGRIEKAWAPIRGVVVVGKIGVRGDGNGAGMLVKFEQPAGGLLTFTLDDTDRISATNVFVKEELGYAEPEGLTLLYDGK